MNYYYGIGACSHLGGVDRVSHENGPRIRRNVRFPKSGNWLSTKTSKLPFIISAGWNGKWHRKGRRSNASTLVGVGSTLPVPTSSRVAPLENVTCLISHKNFTFLASNHALRFTNTNGASNA
jgi:hypothetical protein